MNTEIERKFKVKNTTFLETSTSFYKISQGYLNSSPERTVRVRVKENKGYITVKGIGSANGMSRFEWENEISEEEAMALLELCEEFIISKTRYLCEYKGKLFEVDVFHGHNEGLIIAEVELQSEEEYIELPEWIGDEVTGDIRYYNSYISEHPYLKWDKKNSN